MINTSNRPLANISIFLFYFRFYSLNLILFGIFFYFLVDVKITLKAGTNIDSSYNLTPVSSSPSTNEYVYSCNTYNLAVGSTSQPGCGYPYYFSFFVTLPLSTLHPHYFIHFESTQIYSEDFSRKRCQHLCRRGLGPSFVRVS